MNQTLVPPEAQRAAEQGNLIEAIKITREQTGLGLKEAKDAVEACLHGRMPATTEGGIPLSAIVALQDGDKIQAIRQTRAAGGQGLKESKDAVEAYLAAHPAAHEQYRAASKGRGGGWRWLLVLLALLVLAAVLYWLH